MSTLDDYTVQLESYGTFEMDPNEWQQHRFEVHESVMRREMGPNEEIIILGVSVHFHVGKEPAVPACYVNIVRSNRSVLGLYLPPGFFTPPFAIHCGSLEKMEIHRDDREIVHADVFIRGWRKT